MIAIALLIQTTTVPVATASPGFNDFIDNRVAICREWRDGDPGVDRLIRLMEVSHMSKDEQAITEMICVAYLRGQNDLIKEMP